MAKKLLAFLLTFALILSTAASVVTVTAAEADVNVWDGAIADAFAGGSGTKDDPYQISNGAELAYMFNSVITTGSSFCNDKYFKLTADIYLNDVADENWKDNNPTPWLTSKGDNGYRFTGNFDGGSHTVYGMYYSGNASYIGLLPTMDTYSYDLIVKDLYISDSYISTTGTIVGAVTPRVYSGNKHTANFYNIYVKDSVTVKSSDTSAAAYVGGIVGFIQVNDVSYYQFSGCAVLADISSGHALAGYGTAATVANIAQSYTNAADWYPTNSKTSNTTYFISDLSAIKGKEAAKVAMPGFDWLRIWNCKDDGYPFPMDYNTNNIAGLTWSGLWSVSFAGGSGTEADPYIIETPEQLAKLVRDTDTSGKYYAITADIKLNNTTAENWTENAKQWFDSTMANTFAGTLNGGGNTISGLYYDGAKSVGLFGGLNGAVVNNVIIDNSYLKTTGNVSAFTGSVAGNITYNECVVGDKVTISGATAAGYGTYGGGGVGTITVNSCAALAEVTAPRRAGAFFGDFWGGTLKISNSFGIGALSGYRGFTGTNNYGTVADNNGTHVVTQEQMQGADALKNMPLLTGFGTTDSYPVRYQQGTKGTVWSGSVASQYAGGSGTAADPYIIETGEQLAKLVRDADTSGKYYAITADIKLNDTAVENWTETAKQWTAFNAGGDIAGGGFKGILDGTGHTISGLYYDGTYYYVGMFGAIVDATIKNTTITDSYFKTTATGEYSATGAFTGLINSGNNTYINCAVTDTVTLIGYQVSGFGSRGGGKVTITSCSSTPVLSGADGLAGAFIVDIWGGTRAISNSFGVGVLSPKKSLTSSANNYATVAGNDATVVTAEQMQGMTALQNMPLLTGYFATDKYPVRYNDSVPGAAWSGGIARAFATGDGTKSNPYVIKTGEQLARMLTVPSKDVHFKLGADIVLSDENKANNWLDSSNASVFAGEFYGSGFIISGLTYHATVTSSVYAGLIPVAAGAYISNVILENSEINMITNTSAATYAGGIVGYNTGEINLYSCYVAEGVTVSNTVDESVQSKKNAVGGLLGGGNTGFTIDGCAFFGTLNGFDYRYGAVFGDVWGGVEATRIVKYTMVDQYDPSSRWTFRGSNNVSTVSTSRDPGESFTVVETLKGEEGFKAAQTANWNGRYFGTENYPVLSILAKRFGDVDGDRVLSAEDLTMMKKNLLGASVLGFIDINGDGTDSILDLVKLKKRLASLSAKDGYELVWSDEFDGKTLDDTKWNIGQTRMHDTQELAWSNLQSVRSVSNGNLQLNAMKNPWYEEGSTDYFKSRKYMTTGSVTTENRMSYQYGYLEIRAKVPYKEGCWPSFWLRSHHATGKQENPDYELEIDVFEVFGNKTSMASNLHQQGYNGKSYQTSKTAINEQEIHTFANSSNLSNEYHIYAFEWEPDRMAVYVDGALQCEWSINAWDLWRYGLKSNTSGFDTTLNIIFNNHLFTNTSEYKPSDTNIIENYEDNLPAEYDIDYVRLYQKNDGLSKLILGE